MMTCPPACTAVIAAPLPEAWRSGAATATSQPARTAARASIRSPSLPIPSSLVMTA